MITQKLLINNYMEMFNFPTLKEIADQTGIQVTRVFRILNGHEMRLSEYEIFKGKLSNNEESSSDLLRLTDECLSKLSQKNIKDVYDYAKQKLSLSEFQV